MSKQWNYSCAPASQHGTMICTAEGKASVVADGMGSEYIFEPGEFELVEGGVV